MDTNIRQELAVNGMTCSRCAQVLTEALIALEGVIFADVDATSGRVMLRSKHSIPTVLIQNTVSGAGFELLSVRECSQ